MFMQDGRLEVMHGMILSEDEDASEETLSKLEPLQRGDFEEIFKVMDGLPVTVRLLDPPLHEFLPDSRELSEKLVTLESENGDPEEVSELQRQLRVVEGLAEENPMLGLRGCHLGSYDRRSTGCKSAPLRRRPKP
jgi:pyruvate,orthophosphate dikinase